MSNLQFHFTGRIADRNMMDFYESARFQYAAARLSVKLDQFRRTGRFSKRITAESRTNIDLHAFSPGSFNLNISANDEESGFLGNLPLDVLWSFRKGNY